MASAPMIMGRRQKTFPPACSTGPDLHRLHAVRAGLCSLFILMLALLPLRARAETPDVVVFVAASLKHAVDRAAETFQTRTGKVVLLSYAASSALAKQIVDEAPADVFISADIGWMDFLEEKGMIRKESRVQLFGNTLVLIAALETKLDLAIGPNFPLAAALGPGRLAIGEPNSVPAGKYAKAALQSLGVWSEIEGKLAPTESVTAALLLVAHNEAPFGIVYGTDAAADPRVRTVGVFPAASHPPILYPAAVTARSDSASAQAFLDFLRSDEGRAIFKGLGFPILD